MNQPAVWACLAAIVPIAALFGPALVADRSFAFRDAGHFYYPLLEWCCREWGAGRVPLWNPYENAGLPALADTSSSLFYPGKLVFALPVDFALRYKLFIVGHVVLAAANAFCFARFWKCSITASALASIAYACGGSVVFQYCNVVFLVGAAWLPLAAIAIDGMLRRVSWKSALLLGAVLALMILGGDPQMALNALLVAGLYAAILWLSPDDRQTPTGEANGQALTRSVPIKLLGYRALLIGLAATTGFLLAAVQVLPSSEATRYSERAAFNRPRNVFEAVRVYAEPAGKVQPLNETRGQSIVRGLLGPPDEGSHHALAYGFSVGPWRLAEYFWPNIGGKLFPMKSRWFALIPAEMKTWTPTLYLGLLPILLALSSAGFLAGSARQKWLSWMALLFTLASFGWYGVGWLIGEIVAAAGGDAARLALGPPVGGIYWLMVTLLPSYAYFRYPAKLLPLVSLALAQLAAIGWDRAFAEPRLRLFRALGTFGAASGAAAFVIWCIGPGLFSQSHHVDSSLGPFDGPGAYRDVLLALLQAAAVALAARHCFQKAWNEPEKRTAWQFAALWLTAVELAVANYWLAPTAPAALWRRSSPVAEAIATSEPSDHVESQIPPRISRGDLGRWRPPSFAQRASPSRVTEMAQWEHDTLFPKHQLASGLGLVESYGSVKLMDYESLMFTGWQYGPRQTGDQRLPQPTVLRLLGTEYLVLPSASAPRFATQVAPRSDEPGSSWPENTKLWKMNRTLPRAWIVHEVQSLPPLPFPLRIADVDARTRDVLFPENQARDFRRVAVVETDAPLAQWHNKEISNVESSAGAESCRITHYGPQRVAIAASLAQPGLLVLSDAWFPGWKATVTSDGAVRETPIYQTNRVLRGIWLPAGVHEIEFRFAPASFARGAMISGASWSLLLALGTIGAFRALPRRRASPAARQGN